eukprot:scaffold25143_cov73-Skeletonema_marinoi.AAC.1
MNYHNSLALARGNAELATPRVAAVSLNNTAKQKGQNKIAAPSRALFAVALDCREVERSSAIAGGWVALDFGDIEKDLATKLSDEDIRGVLLSIDAINNLRSLWLTNCINITGVGLEPLRGSTIIQQIDLSLVCVHESCKLDPAPPISCAE